MDKEDMRYRCMCTHTHTHTHNGIVFSHKRNAIMPFLATWVDLEIVILNEVNQKRETNAT